MLWFLMFLLLLITLLLLLPLEVEIITRKDIYEARWSGLLRFRVVPGEERWRWFFRFLFWEKEIKPGAKKTGREVKKPAKAEKSKRKSAFSVKQALLLAKNMLKAIRIKRLWVDWDTGDFVVNAWLFPLVRFLNRRNTRFRINFIGNQEINIFLQTRLSRLGWAFLRTFLHHKK